ncbi:MAG: alpha/beta hydrolase [Victivallaceae bacterium]|nr:alpha/beta hydrolase [Victivallaceae bacterium]
MNIFRKLLLSAAAIFAAQSGAAESGYTYKKFTDVPYLGEGREEKMDMYLPEGTGKLRPAVVVIHGGSWHHGSKSTVRENNICGNLASHGYVAVSIDYLLSRDASPSWPTNLMDCKNAVRFLRANAEKYAIDPDRIGLLGASAGAHLAALVVMTRDVPELEPTSPYHGISDRVSCCVNFYGPMDFYATERKLRDSVKLMSGKENYEGEKYFSPLELASKDCCPFLSIHGKADTTVECEQAISFDAALRKHEVESKLILLDGVGHMFNMEFEHNGRRLPPEVRKSVLDFFDRHLGSGMTGL